MSSCACFFLFIQRKKAQRNLCRACFFLFIQRKKAQRNLCRTSNCPLHLLRFFCDMGKKVQRTHSEPLLVPSTTELTPYSRHRRHLSSYSHVATAGDRTGTLQQNRVRPGQGPTHNNRLIDLFQPRHPSATPRISSTIPCLMCL